MEKYVCIHGHFYQPPRENPWLERIEQQDSAYPYHDWNERITAECYAPNAVSRMLNGEGKIVNIANNYASISFNFGPTLLSWLEQTFPVVYHSILEADRRSQQKFSGHGAALAQAYNHMILPLANDRDKHTQVLWGLRDFEHRFGRKPEGMWLPETAVDISSLEQLAQQGIKFTVLSPYQANKVRPLNSEHWHDAREGKFDPTTAYVQRLPSGRSIALFFYHGAVARGVAFEGLLRKGEDFAGRLLGAFGEHRDGPQLVHIATDGESYGHHHPHGDMALAWALHHIEANPAVRPTIYGEFLEKHPPTHEVQILENTAWSCFHGVERWRSNCGCSCRAGWQQAWRTPLREALDELRDAVIPLFEQKAGALVRNPWEARNDYIAVILNRSPESVQGFLHEHAAKELDQADRVNILKLMELQRNALLMYTSCGWFFDDISGIETVQIIQYAGRVLQLARDLFQQDLEGPFLQRLEQAKSNLPEHRDGRHIYDKWVRPRVVNWNKITAHYAVSSLFEDYSDKVKIYCYQAERLDYHRLKAGKSALAVGRARLTSDITQESRVLGFGMLHLGDHNVTGGVKEFQDQEEYYGLLQELTDTFERVDFPQVLRLFDRGFGESTYSLKSLFRDEQRKVLHCLLQGTVTETEEIYRRIYQDHAPMMRFVADAGMPLPAALRTAMVYIIGTDLARVFSQDEPDLERAQQLLAEAQRWDIPLDTQGLAFQLKKTLVRLAERLRDRPHELPHLLALEQVVDLVGTLPFEVDLWQPQNVYFHLLQTLFPSLEAQAQGDEAAQQWLEHFVGLGDRLGIQVAGLKKKITELRKVPTVPSLLDELFTRTRIPTATYRLQFNEHFTFRDGLALVPYLHDLGISDCYASPILQANPHSGHGYDICDHSRLNPELGTAADFEAFTAALAKHGMGLVLDMVPNHMGIGHECNRLWMDVLENGPSSLYAGYFDIDWQPVNPNLRNKVLLPVLGDQYGKVLEEGRIRLSCQDGAFFLNYFERRFPLSPCTYSAILEHRLEELDKKLGEGSGPLKELKSILTAIRHLPPRTESNPDLMAERNREKEIIKKRIATLMRDSAPVREHVEGTLQIFNGKVGDVASFDLLDGLLDAQAFRPAFWRVATEEINYRRFFDINELAAIRVEMAEVFRATHQFFFELLAQGKASGLRIDHPDGLWNPTAYFRDLQKTYVLERLRVTLGTDRLPEDLPAEVERRLGEQLNGAVTPRWPLYVVAEKILVGSEPLPRDWAVHGTTGYDALSALNGLFVDAAHEKEFTLLYDRFTGQRNDFEATVQASKRMIMLVSLASEINALAHGLDRISERNRRYRDFTLNSLTFAMREIIAFLPVYRTYITDPGTTLLRDRMYVEAAVEEAKKRNPRTAEAIFHFVRDTVLLRNLTDFREEDRPLIIDWAMKFQQLTGPITAKGVEDTSFYLYNRLLSLNEVGDHPDHFGLAPEALHHLHAERLQRWPHSMLAGSTHDTKRSEDVRARLNVLSEIPLEWEAALQRWAPLNAPKKSQVGKLVAPTANDEYLLYQTLVGAWPTQALTPALMGCFRTRIADYMQKATKEAKAHTSWVNPNAEYDKAVRDFVHQLLPDNPQDAFLRDILSFQKKVSFYGFMNSLAQTLLRLTCPGLPDFYQGTELWDFSLVDPDNRRPVDYQARRNLLAGLKARARELERNLVPLVQELMAALPDGRAKLYLIQRTLAFRRSHRPVFDDGNYLPCRTTGDKAEHLFAFTRTLDNQEILAAVPRLVAGLTNGLTLPPLGAEIWHNTCLLLPGDHRDRAYRNVLTGQLVKVGDQTGTPALAAAELFSHFPVFLGQLVP